MSITTLACLDGACRGSRLRKTRCPMSPIGQRRPDVASIRRHRRGLMVDARVDGQRLRRVVPNRAEAEETLRSWGLEPCGSSEPEAGPTLDEVAAEWLLWLEANSRPATVVTAQECLRSMRKIAPDLFPRPAMSLVPGDVRRLKAGLGDRAPATQAKVLVRLKGMLAWAARPPEGEGRREGGGLLPHVPVYVRPPRVQKPSPATVAPLCVLNIDPCRNRRTSSLLLRRLQPPMILRT